MKYPCKRCEKEQMEGGCDNKGCMLWQQWFKQRWAYMQGLWRVDP